MAYDPNDPNDKRIVQGLIDEALASQAEAHEAEVAGLKANRDRLQKQLKAAKAGEQGEDQTAEVERLEGELRTVKTELATAQRELRKVTQERDTFQATATQESTLNRELIVDRGLTDALVAANVAPQFMPAARALLEKQVKVEGEGAERRALGADGKPLGEFVTAWAQGDQGKHYIAAPNNSGGGGGGDQKVPQGGTKKLEDMTQEERIAMARDNPEAFRALRKAAGQTV